MEDRWIPIGRVRKPRGIHGKVTAYALDGFPGAFDGLDRVVLEKGESREEFQVESARRYGDRVIFQFRGVESDPQARKWSGATILRREREFVDLGPDSYYISQLVGCLVELADGTRVGEVCGVVRTGGTDLLRVESPRGEILVPFTRSICTRIEPELQRIRLVPPEGLLELNAV
ncbi:MAG: ribosome maturation factor RimM [Acidobacteriota bacterium]